MNETNNFIDQTMRYENVTKKKPKRFEGWLALFGVLLVLSLIFNIFGLISLYSSYENVEYTLAREIVEGFKLLMDSLLVFSIIRILLMAYLLYPFFSQKRIFPKAVIIFYIINIIGYLAIIGLASDLMGTEDLIPSAYYRNILTSVIWIIYFIKSKRVKETFLK